MKKVLHTLQHIVLGNGFLMGTSCMEFCARWTGFFKWGGHITSVINSNASCHQSQMFCMFMCCNTKEHSKPLTAMMVHFFSLCDLGAQLTHSSSMALSQVNSLCGRSQSISGALVTIHSPKCVLTSSHHLSSYPQSCANHFHPFGF